MPKHTPKPWSVGVEKNATSSKVLVLGHDPDDPGNPWHVAEVFGGASHEEDPVYENAALIAASPDLLGACQALVRKFDRLLRRKYDNPPSLFEIDDEVDAIRAAIRKATSTPNPSES
jgi:hypothetical protein